MKINEIENQLKKLQEELEKLKKNKYEFSHAELGKQNSETVKIGGLEWMREDLGIEPSFGLGDEVGAWKINGKHYYSWTTANIVAREIGDDWRLPTKEELENLCKELGKDFYKIMKPEPNGYCGSTGGLGNQGSYGSWWSSTPYSTTNAYRMHFDSSAVNPSYNLFKLYGFTVRLVRDIER
jgi:hypothetical protein